MPNTLAPAMAANVTRLGVVTAIADGVASSMVTVDELVALLSPAVAVESSTGLVHGALGSLSSSRDTEPIT